ncbi:MAG: hypothetical protein FWG40_04610 [Peptococcaceae bacterium]|nr:hypothetical protein [Peptococcaceae bacterium]
MKRSLAQVLQCVLVILIFVMTLTGCDFNADASDPEVGDNRFVPATYQEGDKITVKGEDGADLYTLTINFVWSTDKRNELLDTSPTQVVVINYTCENLAMPEDFMITDFSFKVSDADGNICDTYPLGLTDVVSPVPVGTQATAEEAYGLLSEGPDFRLMFFSHLSNHEAAAVFELAAN